MSASNEVAEKKSQKIEAMIAIGAALVLGVIIAFIVLKANQ